MSHPPKREYVAKILIIGEAQVGKTSILTRYTDNQFVDNLMPTIGIDYKIKRIKINNQELKLQIWDTAGQERFRVITQNFYKGAMGIILVFDLTDQNSFKSINNWLSSIKEHSGEDVCKIIFGNKSDAEQKVTDQQIKEMESDLKLKVFKTSAFSDVGINEGFQCISEQIQSKHFQEIQQGLGLQVNNNSKKNKENNKKQEGMKLNSNSQQQQKKSSSCC